MAEKLKPPSSGALAVPVTRWPWATLAVTLLASGVALAEPRVADALIFDRLRVMDGEWWRLFTAHWVHFSPSHLLWNLIVIVPAGVWVERLAPARTRLLFLFSPIVIGGMLFLADPSLMRYAGLSGVAAAVIALLAQTQLSTEGGTDRWFWRAVLAAVGIKIGVELLLGQPAFARFADASIRPVPLAHLAGVVCAGLLHFARRPFGWRRAKG